MNDKEMALLTKKIGKTTMNDWENIMNLKFFKLYTVRRSFRLIWTVVYQFWANLIWLPKLGKPGKFFFENNQIFHVNTFFSILKRCPSLI